jgi:WD40 repeat protein
LVASAAFFGPLEERVVKIVDLDTGAVRVLPRVAGTLERIEEYFGCLQFLGSDRLLASVGGRGLVLYDLRDGKGRILAPQPRWQFAVSHDGLVGVGVTGNPDEGVQPTEVIRFNLAGGSPETLTAHGARVQAVALDATARLVATSSTDGAIRIGPVSGEEPHVLLGHTGIVRSLAFSPDGRWLASGGDDRTIRLWPVPDVSKPPPHKWERERFLAMLRAQTNLRAVPDAQSATGWRVDRGPFPGWAKLPEW